MKIRVCYVAAVCVFVTGCASTESVKFNAVAGQTPIVRDGIPAIWSKKSKSIVLLSPALRELRSGERPVFVLAATNISGAPFDLNVANISVEQVTANGTSVPLPVIPYEQLLSEEKTRQVIGALLVGVAAGANSYSASRAGYGTASGTVYGPYGSSTFTTNYYSPTAAAIAQSNANAQNDAMIANTVESGRRNMAALEKTVLKDNTIMPGQWVGGKVYFSPPIGDADKPKSYVVTVRLGGDVHEISATQSSNGK